MLAHPVTSSHAPARSLIGAYHAVLRTAAPEAGTKAGASVHVHELDRSLGIDPACNV